jgi:hypothetical protein
VNGSNSFLGFLLTPNNSFADSFASYELTFSSSLSSDKAWLIGENMAQLELKNILAVNYFTFLNIPTPALCSLMMSPIL